VTTLVERLTADGIVRRYPRCPVCSFPERHAARRRPPRRDPYVQALASTLKVSSPDLQGLLELHECARCASVYCDPWFGTLGMTSLYGVGHGQHVLGWENFLRWTQAEENSPALDVQRAIWTFIVERAGPIGVYGELNCPFVGMFLLLRDLEAGARNRAEESARAIARIRQSYAYPRPRIRDRVSPLAVGRIKRELKRPGRIGPARTTRAPIAPVLTPPRARYLVMEPSSLFWSTNCGALNTSCRALCQSTSVGVPVIDWKDVAREGTHFDVFGLFNVLDHFVDPGRVLGEVLAHSRAVFVETHRSSPADTFSRQHLYALGPRFLDHLLPPGWRWEDVTPRLDDGLQSFYWIWRA
jgi:hypothetical protein